MLAQAASFLLTTTLARFCAGGGAVLEPFQGVDWQLDGVLQWLAESRAIAGVVLDLGGAVACWVGQGC